MIDERERADARRRLWAQLGAAPAASPPDGERIAVASGPGYALERWRLGLGDEPAPALLVRPSGRAPVGVVLYQHAHGFRFETGKDELVAGRPALLPPPWAEALAAHGWAALAIDHRGFGERASPDEATRVKRGLWNGRPLLGQRIADAVDATSWVVAQPALGGLPRAAFGFSMGGTIAWWLAALDARIDAVVEAANLAEFDAIAGSSAIERHGEYYFVPGLARDWTAAAINALVLPRPHLSLIGRDDPLTPADGVRAIDEAMRSAASAAGAPQAWRQRVYPVDHRETAAMRADALAFLDSLAAGRDR